ncbi:hypothetical protein Tco_0796165 [Tanacetum coccineum]
MYAPQWNNMTMDDVVFQTNNVVGNFNYPPNVPDYKPIMKFLLNCPLNKAFTSYPSVVYQNFLREFWSTADAFDPFPSTDEPEKCPFREFLIKFSDLNGQRPLTLDFKTFCSTTGLDYNNDKYVGHPTPEVMKKELVSPLPLAQKTKKGKSQTVTLTLPKSQGPEASGALSKKRKKPKSKNPPIETKTFADIQAYLLSGDELDKESDKEEVLAAGDDIDEDIQADEEVRTPSPKQDQLEPSQVQESSSDSSKAAAFYTNLKASIDQYYDENIAHKDQTDILVEASMSSLDRSSTTISDLYKGMDVITQLLKDINNAVKDDPAANQKINEATENFARISSKIIEVLSLVKGFDFSALLSTMKDLQAHALKQEEASADWTKQDTSEINSMMQLQELKGKGIATELDEDPSKRLVSASTIIRPDPDEPVRVEFLINEKIVYLTEQEIQEREVIKVVQEEAKNIGLDPRKIASAKAAGVSTAQRLQRKYAKCLLLLVHNYSVEVIAASENMLEVTTASEYQVNAAS